MADQKAIPIDKASVPYRFDISLASEIYTFEVHYNARYDYFTLHLEKGGQRIVDGDKIVYGRRMFSGLNDPRLPKVEIMPKDVAGIETRAGWDQIGETVFLFISEGM